MKNRSSESKLSEIPAEQARHCRDVIRKTGIALSRKYAAGQIEHGGKLWERSLICEIEAECIDLNTYIRTFIDRQLPAIRSMIERARTEPDKDTRTALLDEALKFLK